MSKFGAVNDATMKHLEFALEAVRSERGHPLEQTDPVLAKAEKALVQVIRDLDTYRKKI